MADTRNGYDRWKDGIDKALNNPAWNQYDCEIILAVNEFNRHLSGQGGFLTLDWKIIKAMIWVESG